MFYDDFEAVHTQNPDLYNVSQREFSTRLQKHKCAIVNSYTDNNSNSTYRVQQFSIYVFFCEGTEKL